MNGRSVQVYFVAFLLLPAALALPSKTQGKPGRVYDSELSQEEHTKDGSEHNPEYDHEAFLGADEAKSFEQLTPEQSRERLRKLVPKVDADRDGFVTEKELKDWIKFTQNRYLEKSVGDTWQQYDTDADGSVSWTEHRNSAYGPISDEDIETKEEYKVYKEQARKDKKRWKKADTNGDDRLTKEEFAAFTHPEEYEHMKPLVVEETLNDIDKDKDGKLSLEEYISDLYSAEELAASNGEEPQWLKDERVSFGKHRDKNGDGFLDSAEVKDWIIPDHYDHAEAEAKHLIHEADTEPKDGQLTADEIVDKYDLFAGSQATDYGEAIRRPHDEF